MATATRQLSITEQAAQVRLGHVALTVITALFFAFGWAAGTTRRVIVIGCITLGRSTSYAGIAIRYGYRQGANIAVAPAKAPE